MFGANPNTIPLKTVWSATFQLNHYKVPLYPIIADFRLKKDLTDGYIIKRTYSSDGIAGDMGGNGSYATTAATNTEESLTIDTKKYFATQWPSWEKLLWHLNNDQEYREKATRRLINQTDAEVLYKVGAGAGNTMDDGTLGGTSGNAITPTVANIMQMFTTANELLRLGNAEYPVNVPYTGKVKVDKSRKMKVAVIDPRTANILEQFLGGKNSKMGDDISHEGFVQMFMGFNVFVSNNLPYSATLTMTADIGDSETITIAGVTLTAKSTLGTTAGNFKSTGTLATTLTVLAAYINAPFTSVADTASTGCVALTTTEIDTTAKALVWGLPTKIGSNISAVATATTLTITVKGVNKITVSETCANGSWTTALQYTQNLFCISKCIDLVMKRDPSAEVNPVSGQIAKDLVVWNLYGSNVFHDQTPMIVAGKIANSGNTAPTQVF
jgi:hypothetical protein